MLLVDDVPDLRRLVTIELRLRGGFEVVGEAGDGDTAVALARDLQPDLVVLDLGLPRLHGGEVLTLVRDVAPHAKVAVFTGLTDADGEALRGRVEGYVPKDADVAALVDLLVDLSRDEERAAVLELAGADAVARARDFLRFHASRWGWGGDLYEAELVLRELVVNALARASSPPVLRLTLTSDGLRIEVADDAPGTPEPGPLARGWSGLAYVALIAQGWGVLPAPGTTGKVVWARLTPGTVAGPPAAR